MPRARSSRTAPPSASTGPTQARPGAAARGTWPRRGSTTRVSGAREGFRAPRRAGGDLLAGLGEPRHRVAAVDRRGCELRLAPPRDDRVCGADADPLLGLARRRDLPVGERAEGDAPRRVPRPAVRA